jgi:hypothetical protein
MTSASIAKAITPMHTSSCQRPNVVLPFTVCHNGIGGMKVVRSMRSGGSTNGPYLFVDISIGQTIQERQWLGKGRRSGARSSSLTGA